jgi:hypothetical protein
MNFDQGSGAAALFSGVERHGDIEVAMLGGFLRKVGGGRRTGGEHEENDRE